MEHATSAGEASNTGVPTHTQRQPGDDEITNVVRRADSKWQQATASGSKSRASLLDLRRCMHHSSVGRASRPRRSSVHGPRDTGHARILQHRPVAVLLQASGSEVLGSCVGHVLCAHWVLEHDSWACGVLHEGVGGDVRKPGTGVGTWHARGIQPRGADPPPTTAPRVRGHSPLTRLLVEVELGRQAEQRVAPRTATW